MAVSSARIKLNSEGIREVLKSPEVAAELQARAERAAQAARASAPDDEYAARVSVVLEQHATRVVAHVMAEAPNSMLVEANTGNLARALDAAGG